MLRRCGEDSAVPAGRGSGTRGRGSVPAPRRRAVSATICQRSPGAGGQAGRTNEASGTPARAQAATALADICVGIGMRGVDRRRRSVCVAQEVGEPVDAAEAADARGDRLRLGLVVRPASDSVASKRASPASLRASAEASVVPPRIRTALQGPMDREEPARPRAGCPSSASARTASTACRRWRNGWSPRRAGGRRQAPSRPGRPADPAAAARLAEPDRRGDAGNREASRPAGRRAGERRSVPLWRRRHAAALHSCRRDALPAAILFLQPGRGAARLVAAGCGAWSACMAVRWKASCAICSPARASSLCRGTARRRPSWRRCWSSAAWATSSITVLEAMGGPRERVRRAMAKDFDLGEIAPLNTLALEVGGIAGCDRARPRVRPRRCAVRT